MEGWQIALIVVAIVVIAAAVVLPMTLIRRPVMMAPSAEQRNAPPVAAQQDNQRPRNAPPVAAQQDNQRPRNAPPVAAQQQRQPNAPPVAAQQQRQPNAPPAAQQQRQPNAPPVATPTGIASPDAVTGLIAKLRAIHGAEPLVYDPVIASVSRAYADRLLRNGGALVHSRNPDYGENLASFRGYPYDEVALMNRAVQAWYDESLYYNYDNPGFSSATGHFTCLVWRSSRFYGIGLAYDPATKTAIVVMNTAPPGNINTPDYFRANVLSPR